LAQSAAIPTAWQQARFLQQARSICDKTDSEFFAIIGLIQFCFGCAKPSLLKIMCIKDEIFAQLKIHPPQACRTNPNIACGVAWARVGAALSYKTYEFRLLLFPVALGLSGCQTTTDAPVPNSWNAVPAARTNFVSPDRTNSAPLLANIRGGPSTIIEGSGRFVGEPPTGSINRSSDEVSDGVTLNLVNVPAPQAAKTILGDILAVKYTVDPGIEGKAGPRSLIVATMMTVTRLAPALTGIGII
jgi:hypothetical protein